MFSFIHATDLHYETNGPTQVPEANARIACLIDDINGLERKPDFVLLSGDLTNSGSANHAELLEARSMLNTLTMPYYVVAGNHDLAPNRKIAAGYPGKEDYHEGPINNSNYARIFPMNFAFQVQGYAFAGVSLRDGDPDGMLDWLAAAVADIPEKGIVVAHYGLYPPRTAGPLHTWGFSRIATILPRLRSIIDNAGPRIVAYLYGHNHINSVVNRHATYHVSGGGIQKGCTGFRQFRCHARSIECTYHLLSDKALLDFNYWGREKPDQCKDENHESVEAYHKGSNGEQCFVITPTARR